jgi:nuclear pore complex protein Nup93
VEAYSQRLRARAACGDPSAAALGAARLLAAEGLDPRGLDRALQTFELRPSHEDVFRAEAASVGDYLASVHAMIGAAAVREATADAVAAFEARMGAALAAGWGAERRALLDAGAGPLSAPAPQLGGGYGGGGYDAGGYGGAAPAYRGAPGAGAGAPPAAVLRGRAARYAGAVRKLNAAAAAGAEYDPLPDLAAAAGAEDGGGGGGERRTTPARLWAVAAAVAGGAAAGAPPGRRAAAAAAGARGYLEENFVAHMEAAVRAHRATAALGGAPSRAALVRAYLRVRERERGPLDFDAPGGADTAWLRVYTCLRAGFAAEAAAAAAGAREGGAGGGAADAASLIRAWDEGGRAPLRGPRRAAAAAEVERLLRDRAPRGPGHAQRAMALALLAGSGRAADAVLREAPAFFPTIEDFLWLRLCLISFDAGGSGAGADSPSGALGPPAGAAAGGADEVYALADLQAFIRRYPPAHYSHGGREPLLYAVVLLLSLQPGAAVAYLARDAAARELRADAAHLGAALWAAGALPGAAPLDAPDSAANGVGIPDGGPAAGSVADLLRQYGRAFLHADPELALQYYMLAGSAAGGGGRARGALLRELLTESRAYGLLLGGGGAGGAGGALAAFVPDAAARAALLEAVAAECAAAAQLEEAVELFMAAGRPERALAILNRRLSDALEPAAAGDGTAAAEADALAARGAAVAAALSGAPGAGAAREREALAALRAARAALEGAAAGDAPRVLRALADLPFIPTERFRAGAAAAAVAALHPAVADRLEALLLAAAEALAAAGRREELAAVVEFAAAAPQRVGQGAYQRLARLQAGAA